MSTIILSFTSVEELLGRGVITWAEVLNARKFFVKDTKASIFDFIRACAENTMPAGKKRLWRIMSIIRMSTGQMAYCSEDESLLQTLGRLSMVIGQSVEGLLNEYEGVIEGWSEAADPYDQEKIRLLAIRQLLEQRGYKILA